MRNYVCTSHEPSERNPIATGWFYYRAGFVKPSFDEFCNQPFQALCICFDANVWWLMWTCEFVPCIRLSVYLSIRLSRIHLNRIILSGIYFLSQTHNIIRTTRLLYYYHFVLVSCTVCDWIFTNRFPAFSPVRDVSGRACSQPGGYPWPKCGAILSAIARPLGFGLTWALPRLGASRFRSVLRWVIHWRANNVFGIKWVHWFTTAYFLFDIYWLLRKHTFNWHVHENSLQHSVSVRSSFWPRGMKLWSMTPSHHGRCG